eukprot:1157067-Pelagomonas_calceolata.AAC.3
MAGLRSQRLMLQDKQLLAKQAHGRTTLPAPHAPVLVPYETHSINLPSMAAREFITSGAIPSKPIT